MKKNAIYFLLLLLIISCQDEVVEQYKVLSPQYMSYVDLRNAVKAVESKNELDNPGKIYYWNNYLFINEQGKGVHVIDNSNPASPVFKKYLEIPGNVDISVKDGILFADSYIDLVAIDINNLDDIKEINRIKDVFVYTLPPYIEDLKIPVDNIDQTKGVVISYKIKTVEKEHTPIRYYPIYEYVNIGSDRVNFISVKQTANSGTGGASTGGGIGTGGSMARFTITGNALYAINSTKIIAFDITTVTNFSKKSEIYSSWGIETIFPYDNKLFIGSQNGMIVYSIADPFNPVQLSDFWHTTSCDPVVVQGKYAYVTLRNGTTCNNNNVNRLDIVDISTITNPFLVKSYNMSNPHGLAIENSTLFICDGSAGLKIYDASDVTKIDQHLLATYPDNKAFDVIPLGGTLLMIGEDGFYQYNYSNLSDITLLSKIEIKK